MGLREADVLPGRARVAAPVDAVARQDVAANARLTHPDEDEVGIGFGHRDRADRRRVDLEVGDGEPVFAAVGSLPEAAAGRAEVGLLRAAHDARSGNGAAAAIRAEVAPGVAGQEGGVEDDLLGGEGGGAKQGGDGWRERPGGRQEAAANRTAGHEGPDECNPVDDIQALN